MSQRANARASAGTRALNRQPASQQPPSPHHQPPPNQTKPNQPRHHTRQGRPRKTEEEPPWTTKKLPTASSSSLPPLWLRSSFALAPNRSSKSSCVCRGIQTVVIRTPLLCLAVPASRDTIYHFASFSLLLSLSRTPSVAHSLLPPSLSLYPILPCFASTSDTGLGTIAPVLSLAPLLSQLYLHHTPLSARVGSPSTQERLKGGKTEAKISLEPWLRRCLLVGEAGHSSRARVNPPNPKEP